MVSQTFKTIVRTSQNRPVLKHNLDRMKLTPRFSIAFLAFAAGGLGVAKWSAHIGQKVWAPGVFAWRNPLKPQPITEEQVDCPVRLVSPRFYSFMSIGSSIGSVLKIDVKNVSDKPIHSFFISYHSIDFLDNGGIGIQPETLLQPNQSETIGTSSRGKDTVTFSVDSVQFADGEIWFSNPLRATVKPDGVHAGERAAIEYLRQVMKSDGSSVVITVLPLIRSKMDLWKFSGKGDFEDKGFDYGVQKAVVSIEYANQRNGIAGIEEFLAKYDY